MLFPASNCWVFTVGREHRALSALATSGIGELVSVSISVAQGTIRNKYDGSAFSCHSKDM